MRSSTNRLLLGLALTGCLVAGLAAAGAASAVAGQPHRGHRRGRPHRPAPRLPKPLPPVALTGGVRQITPHSAVLLARIGPRGKRPVRYWFQYGTGGGYHERSYPATARRPVSVAVPVLGLAPVAVYHYRLVASSCGGCAAGTTYGADATFTSGGYDNPVGPMGEGADPYVLADGGQSSSYWAFTTGNLFPVLHSTDLVHWQPVGTALSSLPSWVVPSGDWHPWGPAVIRSGAACPGTASSGCYVMFYTGLSAQTGANCVALATSPDPAGPYVDQGPLTGGAVDAAGRVVGCGDAAGYGLIDPSPFVDPVSGQAYLYFSEDFTCPVQSPSCSAGTGQLAPTISVIPLSGDLMHAVGPRVALFGGDPGTWEAQGPQVPTVEGPFVLRRRGVYYLFYSGGSWRTTYGMGYATSPSPTGPFTKSPSNPLLYAANGVVSPGGGDVPVAGPGGRTWLVYHGRSGGFGLPRLMRLDPFSWAPAPTGGPDEPVISGPTSVPQDLQP